MTSKPVVVSPQVTCRFWPSTTKGAPATALPIASRPPFFATRCTWWKFAGRSRLRCGIVGHQRSPVLGEPARHGPLVAADLQLRARERVAQQRHGVVALAQVAQGALRRGVERRSADRRTRARLRRATSTRRGGARLIAPRNGALPVASGTLAAGSNGAERNTSPKKIACASAGPSTPGRPGSPGSRRCRGRTKAGRRGPCRSPRCRARSTARTS